MVTKEDFLPVFQSLFDDTPADQILMNTAFKDLDEWSSLHVLSLIVAMEQQYAVILTAKQIDAANTVEDLFNSIS